MNIIIDLILIAILIASAFLAAKKGLIGTIFSLLSSVISIILALLLSAPVSNFVDSAFVNKPVKKYVLNTIDSSTVGKNYDDALAAADVASKVEAMPEALKNILNVAGLSVDEVVDQAGKTNDTLVEEKDKLVSSIAKPISGIISRVISLVVLFVILNIALIFVAKIVTALFNALPLGKSLNTYGGLAFGIIRGLLIVFVISVLFSAVSKTVKPESKSLFSQKTIDSTVVLKTTMNINPLDLFLKTK